MTAAQKFEELRHQKRVFMVFVKHIIAINRSYNLSLIINEN